MDFTLSNKNQKDARSLHYMHKDLQYLYNQLNEHIKSKNENEKLGIKLGTAGNEAGTEDITSVSDGIGLAMLN